MLKGEKVYLRRLAQDDLQKTIDWINNAEIFVTMGIFGPRTKEAQDTWYEGIYNSNTNIIFAVCRIDSHEHIGNVSLFDIDYRNSNAGLTIMLPDLENRGKGYGAESVMLLCEYAFEYLNLHKLYCKTDNPIASKMYIALGFFQEGILRQQAYHYGEYVDKICFGLLRDEYKKNKVSGNKKQDMYSTLAIQGVEAS